MNRFKEFRREKKVHHERKTGGGKVDPQKHPSVSLMPLIKVPDGEDEHSFSQHNKRLFAEYRKNHPNLVLVNDLMHRSFAQRRKDITETGYSAVESLFEVYPFLQDDNQVCTCSLNYFKVVLS